MKVETLIYVARVIVVIISLFLLTWFLMKRASRLRRAQRTALELLRAVLTPEQYCQLSQRGYVDIASPSNPQRIYRVPRGRGFVQVREKGKVKMWICLQPYDWVPKADVVAIHKLMIEADEGTYLRKANLIKLARSERLQL